MIVTIDFPPPVEARLAEEAQKEGVSVGEIVYRTITEKFPVPVDETAQALHAIELRIASAPTDPDAVREAEEDLLEFQRAINQTRRELGARLVYPDII